MILSKQEVKAMSDLDLALSDIILRKTIQVMDNAKVKDEIYDIIMDTLILIGCELWVRDNASKLA